MELEKLRCSCGYGIGANHVISEGDCCRKEAIGDLVPTNFRMERLVPEIHKEPIKVCDIKGYTISVYTLTDQRLYAQHGTNRWSLPKSEDSVNSIEVD